MNITHNNITTVAVEVEVEVDLIYRLYYITVDRTYRTTKTMINFMMSYNLWPGGAGAQSTHTWPNERLRTPKGARP